MFLVMPEGLVDAMIWEAQRERMLGMINAGLVKKVASKDLAAARRMYLETYWEIAKSLQ